MRVSSGRALASLWSVSVRDRVPSLLNHLVFSLSSVPSRMRHHLQQGLPRCPRASTSHTHWGVRGCSQPRAEDLKDKLRTVVGGGTSAGARDPSTRTTSSLSTTSTPRSPTLPHLRARSTLAAANHKTEPDSGIGGSKHSHDRRTSRAHRRHQHRAFTLRVEAQFSTGSSRRTRRGARRGSAWATSALRHLGVTISYHMTHLVA